MAKIKKIIAREILDSRGNPTIETKVILDNGVIAKASAPSGASTGRNEACELRDDDFERYQGKGVLKAVFNVNEKISADLAGIDVCEQVKIDQRMIDHDGSPSKKNLGANAILSVSLACARAGSIVSNQELYYYLASTYDFPVPDNQSLFPTTAFNVFNGGKHADTNLDFQEFLIVPLSKISLAEKIRMGSEIFHSLGRVLKKAGLDTDVGDEGGYAPDITSSIQAIEFIMAAGVEARYNPGIDFGIGIDVGSSGLYDKTKDQYVFKLDNSAYVSNTLVGLYNEWLKKYPIVYIEDGLGEDDWAGWKSLTKELGDKMMLIGDDLFTTNTALLRKGLKEKTANAILIKPNQVGTLTETIECIKLAKKHNYKTMMSHRSGETTDDFVADLAIATGCDFIKAGSLCRGERLAKYNRMMEIELIINGKY